MEKNKNKNATLLILNNLEQPQVDDFRKKGTRKLLQVYKQLYFFNQEFMKISTLHDNKEIHAHTVHQINYASSTSNITDDLIMRLK